MPQDLTVSRTHQGNFQRRCHGLDGLSHVHRMQQRHGRPAHCLNLRGVSNALTGFLLLSSVVPDSPRHSAPRIELPKGRSPALLPGACATTIEMENLAAAPQDGASDPLMSAGIPPQVANLAADATITACALSPRRCGMAVAVGVGVSALGAGFLVVNRLLGSGAHETPDSPPDQPPLQTPDAPPSTDPAAGHDPDQGPTPEQIQQLLQPLRFNASELDPAHPACQSLGAHVNSRWETQNALEASRTRQGTFDHLRDRSLLIRYQIAQEITGLPAPDAAQKVIGDLWRAGMDAGRIEAEGISPLQPELQAIDGLENRDQLLGHLFNATASGSNPLFDFAALPDLEDPSVNMAYLGQGGLGLPDSAWYSDPEKLPVLAAYQAHVMRTLQLSGMSADDAAIAAADVIALEHALADVSEPFAVLATDMAQYYNPVNLTTAAAHTPAIHWQGLFDAHLMQAPATFSLGMPRFFERLDALLGSTPLQAWKAYLRFHAVDRAAPCLGTTFVANHAAFHDGVLKGRVSPIPRWARVLDIIERCAGDALSPMFVSAAHSSHASQRMANMTTTLSGVLREHLANADWMQGSTRAEALRKAQALVVETGQPAHWLSWEGATTQGETFLHDVQASRAFSHRRNIATVGQPVDASIWKMTAQTADAYLDTSQNHIVLPAALLQPPFFDVDADDALNYGGIGVVLGHEMAHGFDSFGSSIDAEGRLRDWWTQQDRTRFNALAERLATQFSQYRVGDRNVDGYLTLDENLADLGGLSLAFDAMQQATAGTPDPMIEGMTREQRFFANFAFSWRQLATPERTELDMQTDTHVPASVRANGAPSNLPAFARAFNCSPGDPMARPEGERVHFL